MITTDREASAVTTSSEDSTSPQVEEIIYGRYRLRTWFDSPYPDDARAAERLFICERCLKYMKLANTYAVHIAPHPLSSSASGTASSRRTRHPRPTVSITNPNTLHAAECQRDSHPPGKLVYTHSNTIAVYKVDGRKEKLFCQNLSLLGKGFLEHKTLFYDLDSFVFYVLVEHSSGADSSSFSPTRDTTKEGGGGGEAATAKPSKRKRRSSVAAVMDDVVTYSPFSVNPNAPSSVTLSPAARRKSSNPVSSVSSAPLSSFSSSSSSSAISSTLHNTFNIDYDALPHYRVLGYFSKEKHSVEGHNLSCIVVLPPFRRGGLGRMLIELSYRISHLSGQIGTPERPLSDLGLWTYSKFWKTTVARVLYRWSHSYIDQLNNGTNVDITIASSSSSSNSIKNTSPTLPAMVKLGRARSTSNASSVKSESSESGLVPASISVMDIVRITGMTPDDVLFTLHGLGFGNAATDWTIDNELKIDPNEIDQRLASQGITPKMLVNLVDDSRLDLVQDDESVQSSKH